jgi:hypothetical protein
MVLETIRMLDVINTYSTLCSPRRMYLLNLLLHWRTDVRYTVRSSVPGIRYSRLSCHPVLTIVADTSSAYVIRYSQLWLTPVLIMSQTVSSGIQVSECVTAEFAQNSVLPSTLYCVNYKLHN